LYGVPADRLPARVDTLLAELGLSERAGDKAGGYSKGMKQRLALARALLHEPQILFLDEPTAGLDPEAARHVTDLIEQLSRERGRTVLLCTHNLTEAQRLCDRVAVMNQGRALALGAPSQLACDLWRSTWVDVELRVPADETLLNALRSMASVKDMQPNNSLLALQVDGEDTIPAVVAHIAALGGLIMRVNPREHALEEIYFELQKQNRA
jgi:ABC-2 type transport system ATP-binding protein